MVPLKSLFLLLLASIVAHAQSLLDQEPNWSAIEITLSKRTKDSLISKVSWGYSTGMIATYGERILNKPGGYYHFLHLNADSLIDAVYSGPSVYEGNSFTLFINNGDSLKVAAGSQGTLLSISQTYPNSMVKLVLVRYGCCDEPSNELLEVHFNPIENAIINSKGYYFIDETEFPAMFTFRKPFMVVNKTYNLRGSPKILDDEPAGYHFEKGNIVATYNTGDLGMALAEKTDDTGRVWWFVLMNPKWSYDYHIDKNLSDNKGWYGWISSRYIEVLE